MVCVTPPLLAASVSTIRARLTWQRPSVGVLVHDLYGRGVAETGAASGASARTMRVLESGTLLADGVAVIHAGFMADLVEHLGVKRRRIREIRNWNHVHPPEPSASAVFATRTVGVPTRWWSCTFTTWATSRGWRT